MKLAQLTAKGRKRVAPSNFVFPPSKKNPKGRYPIHDASHARNALARSAGKPEESKVKAAVYRKYPQMKKNAQAAETTQRYRLPPFVIRLAEGDDGVEVPARVQLFRTGTFRKFDEKTRKWIRFTITREMLAEMADNFKKRVRGIDIALDFAHRSEDEAAGWFKDVCLENNGRELWGEVDWTDDGKAAVGGKKFRYVSPDFAFDWTDNETGEQYGPTLFGAGLTNRPVIKNMAPTVELTEVDDMAVKKGKKTATKKISEMSKEELELLLSETEDEEKKQLIQLRLDEMDEGDGGDYSDDDDDADDSDDKDEDSDDEEEDAEGDQPSPDDMNHEQLKKAHVKLLKKVGKMQKNMVKALSEVQALKDKATTKEKEAAFAILCAEGKAVPAQKEAYLKGDMDGFLRKAAKTKFTTIGGHGVGLAAKSETGSAQDEVVKLAEKAWHEKKVEKRHDAVGYVFKENPELYERYMAETEGAETELIER